MAEKINYSLNEEDMFEALFLMTLKCNADCDFCCEQGLEKDEDLGKLIDYIDPLVNILGVKIIDLNGGDPLRRRKKDLVEIAKKTNEAGARASISTNSLALTESFLDQVRPYMDIVNVSLHGAKEETHDYHMNVPGSHQRITKNIELLVNKGFDVHVSSVMLNDNVNEAPEMAKLCYDSGVKSYCMNLLFGRGKGGDLLDEEQPSREKLLTIRDSLREKYDSMNIYVNESHIGQCILVRPDGMLTGAPQNPNEKFDGLIEICKVMDHNLREKWEEYPFIENHHKYNREKFKRYLTK